MRTILLLCSMLAAAFAGADGVRAQAPPSPEQLARQLQEKYAAIRDFEADFTQTYRGGALRRETTERGHVIIRKPGRMRWTYEQPEQKLFVSDGVQMYSYVPADRQVIVTPVPREDQATTPILFLAGKGNITRDFIASQGEVKGAPAGTWALKLTPRRKEREYDSLTVVLDPATLRIRMLQTTDNQGGTSTFVFTNMKENTGVGDRPFTFDIPRGVDVVRQG